MTAPRILLIVGGGIAAYKACELVRLIKKGGGEVVCVLTHGGSQFVTPMTLAALSENAVHTSLWDLKDEVEIGHIQLSRQADLVVVCPASADLLAKMAAGVADDLATTLLLATDKQVLAVPAMNVKMWEHPATRRNIAELTNLGILVLDPDHGPMACGEFGPGRLPEPATIWRAIGEVLDLPSASPELPGLDADFGSDAGEGLGGLSANLIARAPRDEAGLPIVEEEPAPGEPQLAPAPLPIDPNAPPILVKKGKAKAAPPTDPDAIPNADRHALHLETPPPLETPAEPLADPLEGQPDFADGAPRPLHGKHILITAGPTHEPIDPVRYIANRSSGRQGYAIAAAAAAAGARVTLVSGPVTLATPPGVERIDVETAREMAEAVTATLPVDVAIMVAAVADWRTRDFAAEKMKKRGSAPPALVLEENPDILASLATGRKRPKLVVGFAAETQDVVANAQEKLKRKAADWIVANDVSGDVMGGADNRIHLVTKKGVEDWAPMPKEQVARHLIERIADAFA
ncbi:phosphopantothenate--cysteine ligase family flavoprotein [Novosphingobium sp. Gsoil 351]|uniref:bifunctional phosphopantothenoylcysteine decarboxylase/phosphopantothenate synthase n=1 Tax=Novosphingobium sp. Gsoil 351 TaxID=2675225 RepID=UPI0012B45777|nr:bifunctional phosphopantothenoylcysteine decarboxylase/phosphopantothenate synthase [Novosphingobium sp. Gsoil 351]QGN54850.1 phosphopantothenoylcysteine synthase [Novosphingobium sp. Gsoil 351]